MSPAWRVAVALLHLGTAEPPRTSAEHFEANGYAVLRGFATADEVATLRSRIAEVVDTWDPSNGAELLAGVSLRGNASCQADQDHSFMLSSATGTWIFPEASVIDGQTGLIAPGVSKRHAVRKIGHGLHLADPVFAEFVGSAKLAGAAAELGWRSPVVVQSAYRLAPPVHAGVERHQDATFLHTEPESCLGFVFAMERADETNGCIYVRPGSHREATRERLVRVPASAVPSAGASGSVGLSFVQVSDAGDLPEVADAAAFVAVPMAAGDVLVTHGTLDHFSKSSRSAGRSRETFQVHAVERDARWLPDNWLQYPGDLSFVPLR